METGYANPYVENAVAKAAPSERATFIKKTYLHLAGAIALFALISAVLLQIPAVREIGLKMATGWQWLIVMGLFMAVSFIADRWAQSDTSRGTQYLGLGIGVLGWAVVFVPLLVIADFYSARAGGTHLIAQAGIITLCMVAGITAVALISKKDFSFLSGFLAVGGMVAIGVIIASIAFGFSLGTVFSGAMVVFASASILHTTSNIIHHYRTDQYVAASLALFAGVALLFWYVLQILISLASND